MNGFETKILASSFYIEQTDFLFPNRKGISNKLFIDIYWHFDIAIYWQCQ